MIRKLIFPLILGFGGCAILVSLGVWQVQRLAWKEGILAGIEAQMAAEPRAISLDVSKEADNYTPVTLVGLPTGEEVHVLVSGTAAGTGYRVISKVQTELGTVLVDQGLLPLEAKDAPPLTQPMTITGNLLWPDDQNSSTPDPDLRANIWFARNVETMAEALDTAPLMVIASQSDPADPRLTPLPVDTSGIKNDHLEYAITWFLLALVWASMTAVLIYRTLRPKDA